MNFDQLQRMTALMCGNIKSSHPLYKWITGDGASSTPSAINIAANRLVRMIPERLAEMQASWTIGPTVSGNNAVSLPADLLMVHGVSSAHQATSPNWSTTRSYPVEFVESRDFDFLAKDTTVTGYPIVCTKIGKTVKLWPTPDSTHIDYMRWYGVMAETALVNAADVFFMNPDFHPLVSRLAASIIEQMRGNDDRAKELLASVKDELSTSRDMVGEENLKSAETLSVLGAPSRVTVHG